MKQKDITLIIVCVAVGAIFSIIITKFIFGTSTRQTQVEVVEKITPEFKQPDERYFNSESINPTQLIEIGSGGSTTKIGQ